MGASILPFGSTVFWTDAAGNLRAEPLSAFEPPPPINPTIKTESGTSLGSILRDIGEFLNRDVVPFVDIFRGGTQIPAGTAAGATGKVPAMDAQARPLASPERIQEFLLIAGVIVLGFALALSLAKKTPAAA